MAADGVADIVVHPAHGAGGEEGIGVEEGEGALFAGKLDAGAVGGAGDAVHPEAGGGDGVIGAVAQAGHQERVGEAGDAKADAALGLRLGRLGGEGEARDVDDIVHHAHRGGDEVVERVEVERGGGAEGVVDEAGEVDRAEQAGAVGRQGLFAAGVGGGDGFGVVQVVCRVDAVDEDHAGFGIVVGRAHDPVPEVAGGQAAPGLAVEGELPRAVGLDRGHEGVGHEHGHVEHAQAGGVGLGGDEILDIGVVAAHGRHHRAAARAGGHDGAAHRVPDVHEAERARGIGGHTVHRRAARADGGEVVADAATLLHGEGRFLERFEDAGHAVGDGAHDEAVEERDRTASAGAGGDPAGGEEAEILERGEKARLPGGGVLFGCGECAGDAAPGVFDRAVEGRAGGVLEAVLHVPDLFGDGRGKTGHAGILWSAVGVESTEHMGNPGFGQTISGGGGPCMTGGAG